MIPVEWLLRLIPRRSPTFVYGLCISLTAMIAAIVVRVAFLGFDKGMGLSVTYLPGLMLATLYAGWRWGLATLVTAIVLSYFAPSALTPIGVVNSVSWMYAVSGLATIAGAATLREMLIRLDEANRRQLVIQTALDRSETRLRLAQEAGDVGLWDSDLVTGETHWSPAFYRNIGVDPKVAANLRILFDIVHPDDREILRDAIGKEDRGGRMDTAEYRVVWPDGSVHWLLSRGEIIRDAGGRRVRSIGVSIDITERRVAYQQVRESEARFRALANSAPVLMWVSSGDGRREFVNQAFVDYLDMDYEAALAFDWRQRLHPEDVDRFTAQRVAGQASNQPFTTEARYRRADGEYRWIRSYSQPRRGAAGAEGFVGIGVDVTDAKRAEADLMHINELLAERVDAVLAERDQAEAALHRAQRLEAVGQLTGGVAHDFNNLLTVIIGALDLIQRHPGDDRRRERMLEAAMSAARRGERLTQQLLAFSRRQSLQPQLIQVDRLLRDSEPLLRQAAGEAVSLTFAPCAGQALARVDPVQFEAAVMNLVVNARDAVNQGGVIRLESVVCSLGGGEVEETPAGDYVCVGVHDTGVGMDAVVAARVFEPFFTTKEVGKGTGLGLSQVYGFARQSGGGVSIESAPGKGASVRIYLPLSTQAAPIEEEPRPIAVPETHPGLTVLLAEDDIEVGDMVTAMLEELGHQVLRADAAEDAIRLLERTEAIDLLLTDLVMPGGKSGVDLAREAVARRPSLSVILSSGYTGEALTSADAAPWPLLRKPYSSAALARMIDTVIAAARENA
jgi:PAS domain S-box-containing protein